MVVAKTGGVDGVGYGVVGGSPWALGSHRGSECGVGRAPLEDVSSLGWSGFGSSRSAFGGVALIGCAGSWFGAVLAY